MLDVPNEIQRYVIAQSEAEVAFRLWQSASARQKELRPEAALALERLQAENITPVVLHVELLGGKRYAVKKGIRLDSGAGIFASEITSVKC